MMSRLALTLVLVGSSFAVAAPTTVALELATNPFVRARSVEQLAERRLAKDEFRG